MEKTCSCGDKFECSEAEAKWKKVCPKCYAKQKAAEEEAKYPKQTMDKEVTRIRTSALNQANITLGDKAEPMGVLLLAQRYTEYILSGKRYTEDSLSGKVPVVEEKVVE